MLTRDELQAVADVAIEHDLVVVTDEVYEHLVFDDPRHVPMATLPGMRERTLTLSSAGKSYSFTGWKVGWATGPAPSSRRCWRAKQWLTFTSGSPLQPAVAHALDHEPDFPAQLAPRLQTRRDLLAAGWPTPAWRATSRRAPTSRPPTSATSAGPTAGSSASRCPSVAGVVAIPTQAFYDDRDEGRHLVRWAFCKEADVIGEGVRRLAAADLSR